MICHKYYSLFLIIAQLILGFLCSTKHEKYKNLIDYRLTCDGNGLNNRDPVSAVTKPAKFNSSYQDFSFNMTQQMTVRDCKNLCFNNEQCLSATFSFNKKSDYNSNCFLFNRTFNPSFALDEDAHINFFKCNKHNNKICYNNSTETNQYKFVKSHRCAGFWVKYSNHTVNLRSFSLDDLKENDLVSAQKSCLKKFYCAAIFKNESRNGGSLSFTFYRDWPIRVVDFLESQHDQQYKLVTYVWKCANCSDNYDKSKWKETTNVSPPSNSSYFSKFYTVSSFGCRKECSYMNSVYENKTYCRTVYYDPASYLCLLESNLDHSNCSQRFNISHLFPGDTAIKYSLIGNKSELHESEDLSNLFSEDQDSCVHFNKSFPTYGDKCNYPDFAKGDINKNLTNIYLFEMKHSKIMLNGTTYRKFDTGYEYIWIALPSKGRTFHVKNCILYSARVRITKPKWHKHVVSKSKWGGMISDRNIPMSKEIHNVIIETTQWPVCGCLRFEHCSDLLRSLQSFSIKELDLFDIGASFLVSSDGRIYEGRGWDYQPYVAPSYYEDSIAISFIGDFKFDNHPTESALNAVKYFLKKNFKDGKLAPCYNLLLKDEIANFESTNITIGTKMASIISNWPHYGGRIKPSYFCKQSLIIEIVCPTVALVMGVLILMSLYSAGIIHGRYCKSTRRLIHLNLNNSRSVYLTTINFSRDDNSNLDQVLFNNPKLQRVPADLLPINLKFSKFSLLYHTNCNQKCSCPLSIQQLYRYTRMLKEKELVKSLKKSYFLQECSQQTCLVLMEPKSHLEKSWLMIVHAENLVLLLEKMMKGRQCFCRRLVLESVVDTVASDGREDEVIEEESSQWGDPSLERFFETMAEKNACLILNGEEVIFKNINPRTQNQSGQF